jgi:hypothetical protein
MSFSLGLKYHGENHFAEDTKHSTNKEVIKKGFCLKHPDIKINNFFGLISNECKRCAEEYELIIETEKLKNKIKIDNLTKYSKKINDDETQTDFKKSLCEIETQTDFNISYPKIEIQKNYESSLNNLKKSLSEFELELSKIDTQINFKIYLSNIDNNIEGIKYQLVTERKTMNSISILKELDKKTFDNIIYTLCEIKFNETKKIEKWFKVKKNNDEYLIGNLDNIIQNNRRSYTFFNGAMIWSDYIPVLRPTYKIINNNFYSTNGKLTELNAQIKYEWYDMHGIYSEKILKDFKCIN